jgi:hypothetical protein
LKAIEHLLENFCGIGICGQCDCLAKGCDFTRDASSLNQFSLTVVACMDSPCKACEEVDSDSEWGIL